MTLVIGKRLAAMVVIILVLLAIVFGLQKASPLDPVHAMLGAQASAGAVTAQRHAMGLDQPVPAQFWHYLTGLLHGDFGTSYRTRRPVGADLAARLPATGELATVALIFALVLAVVLATATTLRWPGAGLFRLVLILGASTPAFLLALGAILLFYKRLGWLPATGRTDVVDAPTGPTGFLTIDGLVAGRPGVTLDALRHLILPALAIAVGPAVSIGRVLRSSLLSNQGSDYVRTARAKGLTEGKVLRSHLLRNSVGSALSMTGLQIGLMFAGVLVIEQVFAWPGIGQYTAQSIGVADFPAITAVTLVLGMGYVVINAIVDIVQSIADPRINV
jgi:peptide/nickel transport system permease protein